MIRPEYPGHYPNDVELIPALGELMLLPKPSVIEYIQLADDQPAAPLITSTSLLTHQDTSKRYSQRIAGAAWRSLNACVPGTRAAHDNRRKIDWRTPDFTIHAVAGPLMKEVTGFQPLTFTFMVDEAVERQSHIPTLGPTAANFLLNLAEVVEAEIDTSE